MIDFENVDCFEKMKSMENNSIDLIMRYNNCIKSYKLV